MRSSQLLALLCLAGEVTPYSHYVETSYEARPLIGREQGRQRRNRFSNAISTTETTRIRRQGVPENPAVDIPIGDPIPVDAVDVPPPIGGNVAGPADILFTTIELADGTDAPDVEATDAFPGEEEPDEEEPQEEEGLEEDQQEGPEEEVPEPGLNLPDIPVSDLPAQDLPVADVPVTDVPTGDVPAADVPVGDVPAVDVPGALPEADLPEEEVPKDELPDDELPEAGDDGADGGLIGDLNDGILTPEGQSIADILLGNGKTKEENFETGTRPNFDDHTGCDGKDPCCRWYYISEELTGAFLNADGTCNSLARQSIRMGFHDAGTWSAKLAATGQNNGGADGSLVLFDELTRPENFGLDGAAGLAHQLYDKYNVTMADLIQYMANHAVVSCPLGPRVRTYVGRKDATEAAPEGLLPSVHAPADDLIALFADKTISAHELTALMGAHSTSTQRTVDGSKAGYPQDTTPGVWDVNYYNETLEATENECIFKFESDIKLSKHPAMAGEWQKFVGGQEHWNGDYARAYLRLSLLGVQNINELKECTLTLPAQKATVPKDADIDVSGKCRASSSSSLMSSTTTATPEVTSSIPMTTTTTNTVSSANDFAVDNSTTTTPYSTSLTSETATVSAPVEVFSLALETPAVTSSGSAKMSETSIPAPEVVIMSSGSSIWASETPFPASKDLLLASNSLASYMDSSSLALKSSSLALNPSEATAAVESLTPATTTPLEGVSKSVAETPTSTSELPFPAPDTASELSSSTNVSASTTRYSSNRIDQQTIPSAVIETVNILSSSALSETPNLVLGSNPITIMLSIVDILTSTMTLLDNQSSVMLAIENGAPTSGQPQATQSESLPPTPSVVSNMISPNADLPSSSPVSSEYSGTTSLSGESTRFSPISTTQSETPSSSTPIPKTSTIPSVAELASQMSSADHQNLDLATTGSSILTYKLPMVNPSQYDSTYSLSSETLVPSSSSWRSEVFTGDTNLPSPVSSDRSSSSIFTDFSTSPTTITTVSSQADSSTTSSMIVESQPITLPVAAGSSTVGQSDSRSQSTTSTVSVSAHPTLLSLVTSTATTRISTHQSSSRIGSASLPPIPRISKSPTRRSASFVRPTSTPCITSSRQPTTSAKKITTTYKSSTRSTMKFDTNIRPTSTRHVDPNRSNTTSTKKPTSTPKPASSRRSGSVMTSASTLKTTRRASSTQSMISTAQWLVRSSTRATSSIRVYKTHVTAGRPNSSTRSTSRVTNTSEATGKATIAKTTRSQAFHAVSPSAVPSKRSSTKTISGNISQARKTSLPGKATSKPQGGLPDSTPRNTPTRPKSSSKMPSASSEVPKPSIVLFAINAAKTPLLSASSTLSPKPASSTRSYTGREPSSGLTISSLMTSTSTFVSTAPTSTSKSLSALASLITLKTLTPPQQLSTLSSGTTSLASLLNSSSSSSSSPAPQPSSSARSASTTTTTQSSSTPGSSSPQSSTIASTSTISSTPTSTSTSMVSSTAMCSMISVSASGTHTVSMRCWSRSTIAATTTSRS